MSKETTNFQKALLVMLLMLAVAVCGKATSAQECAGFMVPCDVGVDFGTGAGMSVAAVEVKFDVGPVEFKQGWREMWRPIRWFTLDEGYCDAMDGRGQCSLHCPAICVNSPCVVPFGNPPVGGITYIRSLGYEGFRVVRKVDSPVECE